MKRELWTKKSKRRLGRREFLEWSGLAASGLWYPALLAAAESRSTAPADEELDCDVLIAGGGLGGCAAALAATRSGARVVLTEPTDWIGGQITQQAVPTDDHRWIESCGCTASYRELRQRIRDHYRRHYPLTDEAQQRANLNPGGPGPVSPLAHEPKVCLAVLQEMLAPAVQAGRLRLLLDTSPAGADVAGDRVRAVRLVNARGRREMTVRAKYFIDASETGELLPLTGTEFVTGSESQAQTGEPHAAAEARPANMQAVTWCYAVDYLEDEDHTIDKPPQYDFWRQYRPQLTPPWPEHPFLSFWYSRPGTLQPLELSFVPTMGRYAGMRTPTLNLWVYRRILNLANFRPGAFSSEITIINWPQNDYMLGNPFGGPAKENARHLEGARQLSLALLYWLQTEAPRPDGATGWRGLRLRPDVLGTADGFAKYPYIRESRRIVAETTILEQHVREPAAQKIGRHQVAPPFADSVGVGSYSMDLHPTTGGDNYFHVGAYPYQIPLGALIPKRMENLLAGCKNIGTTHLSNGAYRLHPTEWNIGEAAGALAAFCLAKHQPPRRVRSQESLLREFQDSLLRAGVELDWSKLAAV